MATLDYLKLNDEQQIAYWAARRLFNILDIWDRTPENPLHLEGDDRKFWHAHYSLGPKGTCQSMVILFIREGEQLPIHIDLSVEEDFLSLSPKEWQTLCENVRLELGIRD